MLNPVGLEQQIKNALSQYLPPAFEQAAQILMPTETDAGKEMCKDFGQAISDMLADPLASSLAAAIDYYVKNITFQGVILTTGSPVAQQAIITPAPSPLVAGVIPNTLKVL
jgi:hypothetical protein